MKGKEDEKCLGTKGPPPGADELYRTLCKLLFTIKTLFALHTFHDPNFVPTAQNVGAININMQ
jgi:hypothetical protein